MFSISFTKHQDEKKEKNLLTLIIKMQILFASTIITSTARTSSVFLLSYGNTIFNPSGAHFSQYCFLKCSSNIPDCLYHKLQILSSLHGSNQLNVMQWITIKRWLPSKLFPNIIMKSKKLKISSQQKSI